MPYILEYTYRTAGKDDKVSTLTFKSGNDSSVRYGRDATVVFIYTQREREAMDKQISNNAAS